MSAGDMSVFSDSYDPLEYTGLTDTGVGFTGSSTVQGDIYLGSPLQLDTTGGITDSSVIDMGLPTLPGSTLGGMGDLPPSVDMLNLSGVSDPPFSSAAQSTPNPNQSEFGLATSTALASLSKFGTSLASLIGGTTVRTSPSAQPINVLNTGAAPQGAPNGTTLSILLVVIVALILVVAKD